MRTTIVVTACSVLPKTQENEVSGTGPVLLKFLLWPGSDYFPPRGVKMS